jgi:uncharacterized protein
MATRLGWAIALMLAAAPSASADTRLVDAARKRDAQTVAALIKQRADVNAAEPDGGTALHWAAHWDDVETARLLIAAKANVNAANDHAVTPLWLAAKSASPAMVKVLLAAGANPNAALASGETILMTAARTGNPGVLASLINAGAQIAGRQLSKGQDALMWAVAEGHVDAARLLIDRGADVQSRTVQGFTPLMFAAREPNLDMVRLLVDRGARLDDSADDGSTPLLVATVRGHVDTAKYLLDRGARPDGDLAKAGYTPLHWAVSKFEGVITFDYPEAPDEWRALAGIPSRAGQVELVKALLARGAAIEAPVEKEPPRYGFHLFAHGRGDVVTGGTPFYMAAMVGDLELMRLLLGHGADPHTRSKSGTTTLMVASGMAYQDNESRVPQSAFVEATKFLLSLGADVRAVNRSKMTALHGAAWCGFNDVLQVLVSAGADVNARNDRNETPLDITDGYHASYFFDRPATTALLKTLGGVGAVERGGFLAGQTKKELEEQEQSKQGGQQ